MRPQLRAASKPVQGPFGHQRVLELRDRPQDLEEHPADGGGGVHALVEDHQIDLALLENAGGLAEVPRERPSRSSLVTTSWSPARVTIAIERPASRSNGMPRLHGSRNTNSGQSTAAASTPSSTSRTSP